MLTITPQGQFQYFEEEYSIVNSKMNKSKGIEADINVPVMLRIW